MRANSFEIYGFDIVLDKQLEPWVIEINLSPACSERQEWLTKMLDDSALDLLNYLQNRILLTMSPDHWAANMKDKLKQAKQQLSDTKNGKYLNTSKFYEEFDIKHRWVRLPESIDELKTYPSHILQQQQQIDL